MAINAKLIAALQPGVTTATLAYTSPTNGSGTRITNFIASNEVGTERYTIYLVPEGDSPAVANKVIPSVGLSANTSDTPSEVINAFLAPGDMIYVQVTTGTTIKFDASGIEF
jgi:hypothetical protein